MLDGLEGTEVIADDILVYGIGDTVEEARENHGDNLLKLMNRVKNNEVKLSKDKMKLHLSEIKYMGHILTTEVVKPDPAKVKYIREMPNPEDKKGVKRILGTVNFLAKFIPNLSQVEEPL